MFYNIKIFQKKIRKNICSLKNNTYLCIVNMTQAHLLIKTFLGIGQQYLNYGKFKFYHVTIFWC